MNNNVIISSRGKGSASQSMTLGFFFLIIGAVLFGVFIGTIDEYTLYKFAGNDRDLADIIKLLIYALPVILMIVGGISIVTGILFKKVYIDIYSDYIQGTFINSKMAVEESVTIMICDIISVSGSSGAVKINTVGNSYQVTVNNSLKKEIVTHLNRVIMERKRNGLS